MSRTYQVIPGNPMELFKQLDAGNIIVNQDTTNAVWLSADADVEPGRGYRLGPLGSLTWQRQSGLWTCVDTGVTKNVTITIGPEIATPVNPVDTTIASMMSGVGIPNTLLLEQLYGGSVDSVPYLDVHKYASILVQTLPDIAAGINSTFIGQFTFCPQTTTNWYINRITINSYYDNNNWPHLYEYINYGNTLLFTKTYDSSISSPSAAIIKIFGSNRFINSNQIKSPFGNQAIQLSFNNTVAAPGTISLTTASPFPTWTTYSGTVYGHLTASCSDVAPTVIFNMNTKDLNNNLHTINIISNISTTSNLYDNYYLDTTFRFIHPFQPVTYSCYIGETHTSPLNINVYLTGA